MQQAPESSRWQCGAWHHPPPSPAFFCSSHNLRKPADCRWRALLCLSRCRQLSAGRRSTPNAHSSCLLLPDVAYTWHYPRRCCPLSSGMWSNTPLLSFFFSKPPYRLLIRPSSTLTKQIIGLQGETGVTTNSCQLKEAQLCILALITPEHIWIPILIWNKAVQGRGKGMQPFVFTISSEYSHLFTTISVSHLQACQWVSCDNHVTLTKSSKLPFFIFFSFFRSSDSAVFRKWLLCLLRKLQFIIVLFSWIPDMLKHLVWHFTLWQHCAYGLVGFRPDTWLR